MNTPTSTIEFINAVKENLDISSDYAFAKAIGITRSQASRYKNKGEAFSDETALRVAEILEIDSGYVLACIHAERAKCTPVKQAWLGMAKQMIAASLMFVFVGVSGAIVPNEAGASELKNNQSIIYIMRNQCQAN